MLTRSILRGRGGFRCGEVRKAPQRWELVRGRRRQLRMGCTEQMMRAGGRREVPC